MKNRTHTFLFFLIGSILLNKESLSKNSGDDPDTVEATHTLVIKTYLPQYSLKQYYLGAEYFISHRQSVELGLGYERGTWELTGHLVLLFPEIQCYAIRAQYKFYVTGKEQGTGLYHGPLIIIKNLHFPESTQTNYCIEGDTGKLSNEFESKTNEQIMQFQVGYMAGMNIKLAKHLLLEPYLGFGMYHDIRTVTFSEPSTPCPAGYVQDYKNFRESYTVPRIYLGLSMGYKF